MRDRLEAQLSDRYVIERELGQGGMATVWLGRDRSHDRPVAIKVLHDDLASAIGVDRFAREVRLTARLRHPGIVPVLDSGVLPAAGHAPLPWYAMPYIAGESLRARLTRQTQLPVDEAVRIARDVADALHAAHAQGIVHRDIKPENIILGDDRVYVVDFGIAKALMDTGAEHLTSTGLAIGTPTYMSPEQATAGTVDAHSDQYSLGAVLYEMLAGEPPFTGPNAQTIIARRLSEPARPIRPVRPSIPAAVEAAVLRALDRVPADRFPDTVSFAAELGRALSSSPASRPRMGRRMVQVLGAVVVVVVASVAAWTMLGRRGGAAPPPRDPALVELYQRAMRGYERRTPAGTVEAIQALTTAIGRDSSYADAWSGLAKVYAQAVVRQWVFPGMMRDSVLRLAVSAVDHALVLDSTDADVWVARATVSRYVDPTSVNPSIRASRKALALDPANPPAWHSLAISLGEQGDMSAAIEGEREAVRRNPAYTLGLAFLALGHFWQGRFDSAAVWADSAVAIDPTYVLGQTTAGQIELERGNFARAEAEFETARRLSTDVEMVNALALRAEAEARAGRLAEARRSLREADSLASVYSPPSLHTAVYVGQAYSWVGDAGRAVDWIGRYPQRHDLHYQLHLRCDPAFAPIAKDPRFRSLAIATPTPGAC
jgi:tetratricopeptide (TPR) repeat protein